MSGWEVLYNDGEYDLKLFVKARHVKILSNDTFYADEVIVQIPRAVISMILPAKLFGT